MTYPDRDHPHWYDDLILARQFAEQVRRVSPFLWQIMDEANWEACKIEARTRGRNEDEAALGPLMHADSIHWHPRESRVLARTRDGDAHPRLVEFDVTDVLAELAGEAPGVSRE